MMNKTLLVYYTLEGNTGYVADVLSQYDNIDIEQLKPQKEPSKHGFGRFVTGGMSALFKSDPELLPVKANTDDYQDIIVAFPIWAGTFPPAIGAFLKQYPFTGKNVYIIACSASGNAEKAFAKVKESTPDNTIAGILSLVNPLSNKLEAKEKIERMFGKTE